MTSRLDLKRNVNRDFLVFSRESTLKVVPDIALPYQNKNRFPILSTNFSFLAWTNAEGKTNLLWIAIFDILSSQGIKLDPLNEFFGFRTAPIIAIIIPATTRRTPSPRRMNAVTKLLKWETTMYAILGEDVPNVTT